MYEPADESGPPVEILLGVAEAAVDLSRLLALDAAWTNAEPLSVSAPDRDRVAAVGERIHRALTVVEDRAALLRSAFEGYPQWFNDRITEAFDRPEFASFPRGEAAAKLASGGNFAARGIVLAEEVIGRIPEERAEVHRKVREIRNGGPIETDFSGEMACGVGALASMGGMAAGVGLGCPPLFFAGAAGLAVVLVAC